MKISFIMTVFNEEKTIEKFLHSLLLQTRLPHEIVIVDGNSTDKTVERIKSLELKIKEKKITCKVIVKQGNRSVGRNVAIEHAIGEIVVCSDSGNLLDKNWIKNITKPFEKSSVDVVAGYYKGKTKNIFQKCLIPFVLVMPDRVKSNNFLPATRSIAFTKAIWKKIGGFNEQYSHNEDYVFATTLKEKGAKIVFAQDAIVNWIPRKSYREAFNMFFRFAFGDTEAGIMRKNVIFLFARYFLGFYLLFLSFIFRSLILLGALGCLVIIYIWWAIHKNYHYVDNKKAYIILPLLQFTADIAVLAGSSLGTLKLLRKFVVKNTFLSIMLFLYILFVLVTLSWGTPNVFHPFPYHMDEWHQLMALKAIVKHGTTTIAGSAEIPFVYPILSGLYLIPFILLHVINPFSLKSPVEDLTMQQLLFEILRSVNILFGAGSVFLIAKIAKDYLKISNQLPIFFFVVTPIFLLLSTYFKYDICLLFWIIFSLFMMLRFGAKPTLKNYLFASATSAVAMGTKFSAIPLLPLLFFAYFWFSSKKKHIVTFIVLAILCYVVTFLLVGVPSVLIGTANYGPLLYSNLVDSPNTTANLLLPYHWFPYLFMDQYPLLFGHSLLILSFFAFILLLYLLLIKSQWRSKEHKVIIFIFICFLLFLISLTPLKIWATRNRALVLLPFLVLTAGWFVTYLQIRLRSTLKYLLNIAIVIFLLFQTYETGAWLYAKYKIDPQKESSMWIEQHIPKNTRIGVEEIVLYQGLPNIIVKEFYLDQYKKKNTNFYTYQRVDSKSKTLPLIVIVSDADVSRKVLLHSTKNDLVKRLEDEGYQKTFEVTPDERFLKAFTNDIAYYLAGNAANPTSITIYKKEK